MTLLICLAFFMIVMCIFETNRLNDLNVSADNKIMHLKAEVSVLHEVLVQHTIKDLLKMKGDIANIKVKLDKPEDWEND